MVDSAVHIEHWGWRHTTRKDFALRHISLDIHPGERVLLLGASGAGKSTLLAGIAGVLGGSDEGEQEGSIAIHGVPVGAQTRGKVGLVLQDPDAQVMLERVGDDVAFGLENLNTPTDEIWPQVRRSLDIVGLQDISFDHPTAALSGGQRQRMALAGVLAMQPDVLVLDEPTANLDPDGVLQVKEAVTHVVEQTHATLIIVEHRIEVWLDLIDRVIVLGNHAVIADGDPHTIFGQYSSLLAEGGAWVPGRSIPSFTSAHSDTCGIPCIVPDTAQTLFSSEQHHVSELGSSDDALDSSMPVLIADNLSFGRSKESGILGAHWSYTFFTHRVYAITGPNGAGKSTLALTLAGLLPPLEGYVRWRGKPLTEQAGIFSRLYASGRARAHALHESRDPHLWASRSLLGRIGMVFQEPEHQFVAPTSLQEVALGMQLQDSRSGAHQQAIDETAMALLTTLQLDRWAKANPHTLSGGEKRRLSVASMLSAAPQVLIMDEPTFGQDYRTWCQMVKLIADIRDYRNCAIIMVTHDNDLVQSLGATTITLDPDAAPHMHHTSQESEC